MAAYDQQWWFNTRDLNWEQGKQFLLDYLSGAGGADRSISGGGDVGESAYSQIYADAESHGNDMSGLPSPAEVAANPGKYPGVDPGGYSRPGAASAASPGAQPGQPAPAPAPGPTPTPSPAATPAPPKVTQDDVSRVKAEIEGQFPWMKLMGLGIDWFRAEVAKAASSDQIIADIRNTPEWKRATSGIMRPDGTMRSNEAEYFKTVDDFRKVQAKYARYSGYKPDLDSPEYYRSFFDAETDPNELEQRYQVYDNIEQGSQDVKDAFFVYGNMKIGTDDLYQAAVNPEYARLMQDQYNQNVAGSTLDYTTWITRATQAGLNRVSSQLTKLQQMGALTGSAVSATLQTDPNFARQMIDVLFHGGNLAETRTLSLPELMNAFEYAMIGSAATANGLQMPTQERVAALRQAGIDRTKALQVYGQFAQSKNLIEGMAQRAQGRDFTQSDFEKAVFLNSGEESSLLNQAYAVEKAAGATRSNFGFAATKQGRLQQPGKDVLY